MLETLREMMLGICFWLILHIDIIFTLGLLTIIICGSINIVKQDELPIFKLCALIFGVYGASILYSWFFNYPMWPFF